MVHGDVIHLVTADNKRAIREIQTTFDIAAREENGGLVLETEKGDEFIPRLLHSLSVQTLSVSLKKPTLNDVFLKLTGQDHPGRRSAGQQGSHARIRPQPPEGAAMIQLRPIYVICLREFIKFFREKSRLLGTLARPVLWLFVVGNGMSSLIKPQAGFSYLQFIFPGMIGMTILFSSIFSSISIVWDREFGFMKEMLVAPISRLSIVIGKAISGHASYRWPRPSSFWSSFPFSASHITIMQFVEVVAVSVLVSFCITSLGILIAARLTSFDGFNIIMNFLVMPMFFLSGAMYPVTSMPSALRAL